MKVAIVHDVINQYGGAEKVLEELRALYPDATILAPTYHPDSLPPHFRDWNIQTSWLDRVPGANRFHRFVFPLYPFAMHSMAVDDYDLVISSSFNFAHNITTGPDTAHLCYCHSPSRFLWDFHAYAQREGFGALKRSLILPFLPPLRALDLASAQGVDHWIGTSELVRRRIAKTYRRRSALVAPPINVTEFNIATRHDGYYLLLMRLVGWKRADIAIQACNRLGLKLVVAGSGRDEARLKDIAGPTIEFAGRADGVRKARLFSRCAAFILPAVEDFGITPLEAMASGRPVIALGQGGALDTVVPGVTGEFFMQQTADSLAATLQRFDPDSYDPQAIRRHAEGYDSSVFRARMQQEVARALARRREPGRVKALRVAAAETVDA
jgi:glycosyltransferase involved in cell wall biosynthesis